METARVDGLDLRVDPRFERRSLVTQRVAAVVGVVLFVAALVGVFGKGPLAHASRQAPNGALSLDYDRFVWTASSTSLKVQVNRGGGLENIALSDAYLRDFNVGDVEPQPVRERALPDRTVYTVNLRAGGQVQFYVVPEKIGLHRGTVYTHDGAVSFRQFVYP